MISSYLDLKTNKMYKMLSPALILDREAPPFYYFPENCSGKQRKKICEEYSYQELECKFLFKVSPELFVSELHAKERFGSDFVAWPAEDADGKPIQIRVEVKE